LVRAGRGGSRWRSDAVEEQHPKSSREVQLTNANRKARRNLWVVSGNRFCGDSLLRTLTSIPIISINLNNKEG
jgi:hypothetical protein